MGIVDYANRIDVTDYEKTDPLNRLPQSYKDSGLTLNTIYINGRRFDGLSRDSKMASDVFAWSKEPSRNNLFVFENMDQIPVGLVSQCDINLKYCNIQDFIAFKEAIKQRYFYVTFFNLDSGEWEYHREMYCSKNDRGNLYYFNPKLLGILDLTVTFVATNRDKVQRPPLTVNLTYPTVSSSNTISTTVNYGDQYLVELPSDYVQPSSSNSPCFVDDKKGFKYIVGDSITVFRDFNLTFNENL